MKKLLVLSTVVLLGASGCRTMYGDHDHDHGNSMDGEMHDAMHTHMKAPMNEHMGDGQMSGDHMNGRPMHGEHMHGDSDAGHGHGGHAEQTLAGRPGKKENVSKTIHVTASDDMRFQTDAPLTFKEGETVEFIVTNTGSVVHEFVIGTKDEHMEHGEMMMKMPNMHHAPGGNALTLQPGETKSLIWQFDNAWQIEAACNVPGHYQAGMHNPVTVSE